MNNHVLNGRRMRIIPFRTMDTQEPMYTLVMEWFKNGKCERDAGYQMKREEFLGLCHSCLEALEEHADES